MTRGRIGRADLITAIGLATAESTRAAALVGYERIADDDPEPKPEEPRRESPPRVESADEQVNELLPAARLPDIKLRAWHVVAYERLQPPPDDTKKILTRPVLPDATRQPPSIAPLAPARSLLVRLRGIWQRQSARGIDIEAAIERISLGEILLDLPQRQQRKWGSRLEIIVDRSERLVPYWADQDYVVRALLALFPSEGVGLQVVSEIDDRAIAARDQRADWSDTHLLILGDLGALEQRRHGVANQWAVFGKQVRFAGGRPLALSPCRDAYLSPQLRDVWEVLPWEPVRPADELAVGEQQREALHLLQILLAKAIRLEPGLVRQIRRILPVGGSDAALESLFWQDEALIGTSELAATWLPDAAKRLKAKFDGPFHPRADELRERALQIQETWRAHLPAEIFFEELLGIGSDPAVIKKLGWQELYQQSLDYFRWLRQTPGALTPGGTAADWFRRLEQRLSDHAWRFSPAAEDLAHLWSRAHQDDPEAEPPPYLKTVAFDSTQSLPEQTGVICEGAEGLTVQTDAGGRITSRVVARIATRNRLLTAEAPFWNVSPPPAFAKRCRRDEFGPWFTFEVEQQEKPPVVQRMRWIPAGSFLMGSPESDPDRMDREGPQHQVRTSRGFWIFDTPCTQQLWAAVMDNNPSYFRGDMRPVEQVSWHDVQEFAAKLHEKIGLELSLPTEAQWEYACRAGTTTRYHFGDAITPRDCRYWESKEHETAVVGSYRPNRRGLFDMHGNVDEWCRDGLRNYASDPAVDPIGVTEWNADRVIRGGSWINRARPVRAAYRYADDPGLRFGDLGFRCVWVQSVAEPVETVSERAERGAEPSRTGGAAAIKIENRARQFGVPAASRILVRSDCEQLELQSLEQPAWASAFGRDRYGLWADLTLQYQTETAGEAAMKFWVFEFSKRVARKETRKVTQRLRWIPPGQMLMGSPEDEEGRYQEEGALHVVTLSKGFWLFDTPCTQELWQAVMGENPSHFKDLQRPVESIDWHQASEFSRRLSDQIPQLAFNLPTEAQWEYACRAGTDAAIYTGELKILGDANAPALDPIAWYGGNSGVDFELENGSALAYLTDKQYTFDKAGTRKVKQKKPNPRGLYDMLGNVWEWCHDGQRSYTEDAVTDPLGSLEEGASRVIRGGCWFHHARSVRAAYRYADVPGNRIDVSWLPLRLCPVAERSECVVASRGTRRANDATNEVRRAMQIHTFRLSAIAEETELEPINQFLAAHKILNVETRFVDAGENSFWSLLVRYTSGKPAAPLAAGEKRIDYKEVLAADEFDIFSKLRNVRKALAEQEGVPVYAVFTNEQLAEIARQRVTSLAGLVNLKGVGKAKADKYGAAILQHLHEFTSKDEKPDNGQASHSDA